MPNGTIDAFIYSKYLRYGHWDADIKKKKKRLTKHRHTDAHT